MQLVTSRLPTTTMFFFSVHTFFIEQQIIIITVVSRLSVRVFKQHHVCVVIFFSAFNLHTLLYRSCRLLQHQRLVVQSSFLEAMHLSATTTSWAVNLLTIRRNKQLTNNDNNDQS
jgi:hypothetical protein